MAILCSNGIHEKLCKPHSKQKERQRELIRHHHGSLDRLVPTNRALARRSANSPSDQIHPASPSPWARYGYKQDTATIKCIRSNLKRGML